MAMVGGGLSRKKADSLYLPIDGTVLTSQIKADGPLNMALDGTGASQKITNVADGTSANDACSFGQRNAA